MRERGERSPSCCSSEEGQHWREPVWPIKTPTNHKSLQTHISKAYFVCLTPDEGSLAQTWWYLFSGSGGSSSTKPEMLYLLMKMGWDLKTTTNSQHSPLLPGDISIGIAPSHHNGLPIRNTTGTSSTMAQLKGFATWELFLCYWTLIPGTISAVSLSAFVSPPSRTMESRGDGGVHAVWYLLPLLLVKYKNGLCNARTIMIPHSVQGNPAVVAASPRNAGIGVVVGGANAPSTDDYSSSWQERDAVVPPWLWQVGNRAAGRGWVRNHFNWCEDVAIVAAHQNLPWYCYELDFGDASLRLIVGPIIVIIVK